MKNYSFKPGLIPSFCLIVVLPLFIALGIWQLHRAEDKKSLMAAQSLNRNQAPVALKGSESDIDPILYRPVFVTGEYDGEHQFLLDNQISNRRAGYHVFTPLRIEGSSVAVMVDRGWLPVGADRKSLPDIHIEQSKVRISGIVKRFPGIGFKLQGGEIPTSGWPSVLQWIEADQLAKKLGYPVLPYQVLLDAQEKQGYERDWQAVGLNPEKNLGYALQWFSFAFISLVLYVWHGFKLKHVKVFKE